MQVNPLRAGLTNLRGKTSASSCVGLREKKPGEKK